MLSSSKKAMIVYVVINVMLSLIMLSYSKKATITSNSSKRQQYVTINVMLSLIMLSSSKKVKICNE